MHKTVVLPAWQESPSAQLDGPYSAYATVTDHEHHRRVLFSGALAVDGDIAEQVRAILRRRADSLADFGGSMDDVVVTRYFVRADRLDRETQARIHEARDEFFDHPHYPASTMVATPSLLHEDALVEIEVEAEIPNEAWDVDVVTGEE